MKINRDEQVAETEDAMLGAGYPPQPAAPAEEQILDDDPEEGRS
jgi:hypothetical protein